MYNDEPPWDFATIREYARLKPDLTAEEIGRQAVAKLTKATLQKFAAGYVTEWVDAIRRADAREIEKAAEQTVTAPPKSSPSISSDLSFQDVLDNPEEQWQLTTVSTRAQFKKWAGDRFKAWHKAAKDFLEARTDPKAASDLEMFEADWYPGGVEAYHRRKRNERVQAHIDEVVAEVSAEVRLETTRELLESIFALGDGERVTWGAATVEEHQKRVRLLVGNSVGSAETAARHQAAIRMIEAAGVTCLNDLADQPAVS